MLFDIGWSELLIVAAVAIIVVGPKELPVLLRSVGRFVRKIKDMAREFQNHIEDAIDTDDIKKLRDDFEDIKKVNPINKIKDDIEESFDFSEHNKSIMSKDSEEKPNKSEPTPQMEPISSSQTTDKPEDAASNVSQFDEAKAARKVNEG